MYGAEREEGEKTDRNGKEERGMLRSSKTLNNDPNNFQELQVQCVLHRRP